MMYDIQDPQTANTTTFGQRLKTARERAVMSLADLAFEAKVAYSTIARLEAGEHSPHPRTIRRLAEALGVTPQELAGIE